jgi:toxin-antitoxin system PIN domain toxin
MRLFDVNILVQAFREDAPDHALFLGVLERYVNSPAPFGISRVALSGFMRIVTHPRIFLPPAPVDAAIEFCDDLASRHNFRWIEPGSHHWSLFTTLCSKLKAEGNLIPDVWFAALAIEAGCTWVSGDRDYGLIPGLDWEFIHR